MINNTEINKIDDGIGDLNVLPKPKDDSWVQKNKDLCDFLSQCQEIGLFYVIRILGDEIHDINESLGHKRVQPSEEIYSSLGEYKNQIQFAVGQTKRFGVEVPMLDNKNPTEEYRQWFKWWNDYENSLPPKEFEIIEVALAKKQDVSKWRPLGSWKVSKNK